MSHTHTYAETMRFQEDSETTIVTTTTNTITDDLELNLDTSVDASTETQYATVDVDMSEVTSMYFLSDQSTGITANSDYATNTNSQQIDLTANEPYYWHSSMAGANPWTVDLTSLYVKNNSSTTAANVKVRFLFGTP